MCKETRVLSGKGYRQGDRSSGKWELVGAGIIGMMFQCGAWKVALGLGTACSKSSLMTAWCDLKGV